MPQTKILVDSTCYFRLAQNVHPLLGVPFGSASYALYAHEALVAEFQRKPSFRSKFDWFLHRDYVENRKYALTISRKDRAAIAATKTFIEGEAQANGLGVSPVDVAILATALELRIGFCTDDQALCALAKAYDVEARTSLQVLKLMLDEKRIDIARIERVVAQWHYDDDLPANFHVQYRQLFGRIPPKE